MSPLNSMLSRALQWWYQFSSTVGNVGTKQWGVLQEEGWRGSSEQAPFNPLGQKNLWILQCTYCEVLVLYCKYFFISSSCWMSTKSQCPFLMHLTGFLCEPWYEDHTGRNENFMTLLFPIALQDLWSFWGSFHSFYISSPLRRWRK